MQRLLFHDLNLLTFLVANSHNQSMVDGQYLAVLVPQLEMGDFIKWLDESLPTWKPLPCTEYTKETYTAQLWKLADQQFNHGGIFQFVPLHVDSEGELMFTKLSWNVIQHYPWSQHN